MHAGWERDLAVAVAAAREAGAQALAMQGGITADLKADGTPVTAGDRASDAVIRHVLTQHAPGDGLLSEEDDADARGGRTWIVDPIDGTSGYLAGGDDWCVQIGLAIDGRAVLGVLDLPRQSVRLSGVVGIGAWIEDADGSRPLRAPDQRLDRLVTSTGRRNPAMIAAVLAAFPEFATSHVNSVGVKAWHLLGGRADLYVHARPISAWDVAGPAAVLIAAGATATDQAGRTLVLGGRHQPCPGLVASVRRDHAALAARLDGI